MRKEKKPKIRKTIGKKRHRGALVESYLRI